MKPFQTFLSVLTCLAAVVAVFIMCTIERNTIKHLPHHDIIVFDSSVNQQDLNSNDVFRILARKGDTIVLTYYY